MLWMPAGFDFGTTMTSVFRVNTTGFEHSPFAFSCAGSVVFADAKASTGAPSWICAASALEPANEYFGVESIFGKTSVSDAAAYTVICARDCARAPAATPATTRTARQSATKRLISVG